MEKLYFLNSINGFVVFVTLHFRRRGWSGCGPGARSGVTQCRPPAHINFAQVAISAICPAFPFCSDSPARSVRYLHTCCCATWGGGRVMRLVVRRLVGFVLAANL